MELRRFINIEFSFYELFQFVGLSLLGCEVKEIISKENLYKIEVE